MNHLLNFARFLKLYIRTVGLKGLWHATKVKLFRAKPLFAITREGCKQPIWVRIPTSDIDTYNQVFLWDEYAFNVSKEPKVIVDAGANIGLASIYFANKYPNTKIISIEPEVRNYELLKKNLASYENVHCLHAAVWNVDGTIELVDPGLGNWGFMTQSEKTQDISAPVSHTVNAYTIETIMEKFDIDRIDILKVDIEGAEKEVFENPEPWVDRVDSIIAELHEHMKPGSNRSFYNGTNQFDQEWIRGENFYLTRSCKISKI